MNDGEMREDVAANATVFQGMGKSAVFIEEKEIFVEQCGLGYQGAANQEERAHDAVDMKRGGCVHRFPFLRPSNEFGEPFGVV